MAKKIKDLAVATGTYQDGYGQEKRRYMNCGAVMENDDGGMFIMLNRFIDYAAIPNPKGGESLLISAFDLKDRNTGGAQGNQASGGQQPGGFGADEYDVAF